MASDQHQTTAKPPANDNPDEATAAKAISLTDLAAMLGIDEDEAIERIGDILLRREANAGS